MRKPIFTVWVCLLVACAEHVPKPFVPSPGHINNSPEVPHVSDIPPIVDYTPILPPPAPPVDLETYTVVVNEVPVKELLFALARDTGINVDIDPAIQGVTTINAIEQTLPQILERVAGQVPLRYQFIGDRLEIQADSPFWKSYQVDYMDINRNTEVRNTTSVEIGSGRGNDGSGTQSNNTSSTSVESNTEHNFWRTLEETVDSFLHIRTQKTTIESDTQEITNNKEKASAETETAEAKSQEKKEDTEAQTTLTQIETDTRVIASPEAGVLLVRATQKEHQFVQQFVDQAIDSARRQVLIQATIVEVQLSRDYQAGIDWQSLNLTGAGFSLGVNTLSGGTGEAVGLDRLAIGRLNSTTGGILRYNDANASGNSINATIQLLDEFGDVKVLSSPQLMTLNNQTAILKVVDNIVYFTIERDFFPATVNSSEREEIDSEPHVVPVGIVMSLTPYIGNNDEVILQVRPNISVQVGDVEDPANPGSVIPEIRVREMESILRLSNGQTGVLGGLMQDSTNNLDSGLPGLANIPLLGRLFSGTRKDYIKTELIIFLRPIIVKSPSLEGDLSDYQKYLPNHNVSPVSNSTGNTQ